MGFKMARRTKKVGICGKYGTRYGATLRKLLKKIEVQQHSKYTCVFCGKDNVSAWPLASGSAEAARRLRLAVLTCWRPPLPPPCAATSLAFERPVPRTKCNQPQAAVVSYHI